MKHEQAFRKGQRDPAMSVLYAGNRTFLWRKPKAYGPWWNWYINRGRVGFVFTKADLRRNSWRRAL